MSINNVDKVGSITESSLSNFTALPLIGINGLESTSARVIFNIPGEEYQFYGEFDSTQNTFSLAKASFSGFKVFPSTTNPSNSVEFSVASSLSSSYSILFPDSPPILGQTLTVTNIDDTNFTTSWKGTPTIADGAGTPNSLVIFDSNGDIADLGLLEDGDLVIGRTGQTPVATPITGTANIQAIPGSGSLSIDTTQDINLSSSPEFVGLTLTGLSDGFIGSDATGIISNRTIQPSDIPSNIDASKISSGIVSDTEFDFLDGTNSNIQSQLDGKLNLTGGELTGDLEVPGLTVNDNMTIVGNIFTSTGGFTSNTGSITLTNGNITVGGSASVNSLLSTTSIDASSLTITGNGLITGTLGVGSQLTSDSIQVVNDANINGDLVVQGDFTVNGTRTTLNTQTLDVEDQNITVNIGGNDTSAEGAGLTVERTGTDGSIIYEDALASKWKIGSIGSESEIIDANSQQDLSNKNILKRIDNVFSDLTLSVSTNDVVLVSGDTTITLPSGPSVQLGQQFTIKKTDSNTTTTTVVGSGGNPIDGQGSIDLNEQYESITVVQFGGEWHVI